MSTLPYKDVMRISRWMADKLHLLKFVQSAAKRQVYRGQIYWCLFGQNVGSEQSERRPALIIQNDPSNRKSPNVIVAPITNTASSYKSVYPLKRPASSPIQGYILLGNIQTVSKARLGNYIDVLDPKTEMPGVEEAIFNSLGVAGKIAKIQNDLQRTTSYLETVKKVRNQAVDDLTEVKSKLGLPGTASQQDILQAIESLQKA